MTKEFICSLPWTHLSIMPHGVSSICCVADHSNPASTAANDRILNASKVPVIEIINSDNYKTIRKQMLEGKVPAACVTCKKVENVGGISKRIRDGMKDGLQAEDFAKITQADGTIVPNLEDVELRLGNFCNLKCRGCNAESSTSWIPDYYKSKDIIPLPSSYDMIKDKEETDYSWCESEKFYDDLLSCAPRLKRIHISGGEPFILNKHKLLLDKLIDLNLNKSVQLFYITNLNYPFEKIRPILESLSHFDQVYISFSIDDVGERNSYFRSLSDWDLTISNLKRFLTEYPTFRYSITQTVNVFNFLYVEELYLFLQNNNLLPRQGIIYNHIHAPEYLSANLLPLDVRQSKINQIRNIIPNIESIEGRYYNSRTLDQPIKNTFVKVTEHLDMLRNEDFRKTFPELAVYF